MKKPHLFSSTYASALAVAFLISSHPSLRGATPGVLDAYTSSYTIQSTNGTGTHQVSGPWSDVSGKERDIDIFATNAANNGSAALMIGNSLLTLTSDPTSIAHAIMIYNAGATPSPAAQNFVFDASNGGVDNAISVATASNLGATLEIEFVTGTKVSSYTVSIAADPSMTLTDNIIPFSAFTPALGSASGAGTWPGFIELSLTTDAPGGTAEIGPITSVPEPSSAAMVLCLGLVTSLRRKRPSAS